VFVQDPRDERRKKLESSGNVQLSEAPVQQHRRKGFLLDNSNSADLNRSDESNQSNQPEALDDNKMPNPALKHNPFISPIKKAPTLRRVAGHHLNSNLSNSNKNKRGIKRPHIIEYNEKLQKAQNSVPHGRKFNSNTNLLCEAKGGYPPQNPRMVHPHHIPNRQSAEALKSASAAKTSFKVDELNENSADDSYSSSLR
jgi:hypothetical protein